SPSVTRACVTPRSNTFPELLPDCGERGRFVLPSFVTRRFTTGWRTTISLRSTFFLSKDTILKRTVSWSACSKGDEGLVSLPWIVIPYALAVNDENCMAKF